MLVAFSAYEGYFVRRRKRCGFSRTIASSASVWERCDATPGRLPGGSSLSPPIIRYRRPTISSPSSLAYWLNSPTVSHKTSTAWRFSVSLKPCGIKYNILRDHHRHNHHSTVAPIPPASRHQMPGLQQQSYPIACFELRISVIQHQSSGLPDEARSLPWVHLKILTCT